MSSALRPDNRPAEQVWKFFDLEFAKGYGFPNVSWALGSDWGMGASAHTEETYKAAAEARMVAIYGPRPSQGEVK